MTPQLRMPLKTFFYLAFFLLVMFIGYRFFFHTQSEYDLSGFDIKVAHKQDNIIPMAVIGSGPAGLSAALYGARGGFYTVLFEGTNPGGQLMGTSLVENWPGLPKSMGPELIAGLRQQAQEFGAVVASQTIEAVDFSTWPFVLTAGDGTVFHALSVVIATGADPNRLGVPGEDAYWGKGVTTCAVCDAPFYKNLEVFVVGGGDSAVEEVLQLAPYASKITLLVRGEKMRASHVMQERLKAYNHVHVQYNTKITAIHGDEKHVTNVDLDVAGEKKNVKVSGIFLATGHTPNSALFKPFVKTDNAGYITARGGSQKTSLAGVFVAGDVSDHVYRQAGVASGNGIKAALDASEFLRDIGYSDVVAEKLEPRFFVKEGGEGRLALQEIESLESYEKLIAASGTPIFLDFFTEFCTTCKQMLPSIEVLAKQIEGKMAFFKVDAMKAASLADKFEVTGVPAFIIVKNGELVARAQGTMTPQALQAFIEKTL